MCTLRGDDSESMDFTSMFSGVKDYRFWCFPGCTGYASSRPRDGLDSCVRNGFGTVHTVAFPSLLFDQADGSIDTTQSPKNAAQILQSLGLGLLKDPLFTEVFWGVCAFALTQATYLFLVLGLKSKKIKLSLRYVHATSQ